MLMHPAEPTSLCELEAWGKGGPAGEPSGASGKSSTFSTSRYSLKASCQKLGLEESTPGVHTGYWLVVRLDTRLSAL